MSTTTTGGVTNLRELLRSMSPELRAGEFVFANVTPQIFATLDLSAVECFFRESATEITVIMTTSAAQQASLPPPASSFAWITLTVHSSLEAVGLTAAFASALGDANISCNVVAAYYHDHIFVPSKDAAAALQVLRELAIISGASK